MLLLLIACSSPAPAPATPAPVAPVAAPPPPASPAELEPPRFQANVGPLPEPLRAQMRGVSWREGCPVSLDALSLVELTHWDMDGELKTGRLIVATEHAEPIRGVFERLFDAGYPITSIRPVSEFGGDDDRSMKANNSSAFNCRPVSGGRRYSEHSFGHALDLNPLINPWVRGDKVAPPEGRPYADRSQESPGLIQAESEAVTAFAEIGWSWGGTWKTSKDYQHFSATGR